MKSKSDLISSHAGLVALVLTATLIFAAGAVAKTETSPSQVNINTADSGQLAALPGIGQSKAEAIVEYRSEHGPFSTVDSLTNVRGIGMKVLEKIRPFVTIRHQ
jgi:competence protein ComEA